MENKDLPNTVLNYRKLADFILNLPSSIDTTSIDFLLDDVRQINKEAKEEEERRLEYNNPTKDQLREMAFKYVELLEGKYELPKPYKEFSEVPRAKTAINQKEVLVHKGKHVLFSNCPHPIYKGLKYIAGDRWIEGEPIYYPIYENRQYLKSIDKFFCTTCKGVYDLERRAAGEKATCKKCKNRKIKEYFKSDPEKLRAKTKRTYEKRKSHKSYVINTKLGRVVRRLSQKKDGYTKMKDFEYFLGITSDEFLNKFNCKDGENIDHIIPLALEKQIYNRNLVSEEYHDRVVRALWHCSNIQILPDDINQQVKGCKVNGVYVYNMPDEQLLEIARKIVDETERIRKTSGK